MHMSRQPQVIRRGECNPRCFLCVCLGGRHLPNGNRVFRFVIPSCLPSERLILYSVADFP